MLAPPRLRACAFARAHLRDRNGLSERVLDALELRGVGRARGALGRGRGRRSVLDGPDRVHVEGRGALGLVDERARLLDVRLGTLRARVRASESERASVRERRRRAHAGRGDRRQSAVAFPAGPGRGGGPRRAAGRAQARTRATRGARACTPHAMHPTRGAHAHSAQPHSGSRMRASARGLPAHLGERGVVVGLGRVLLARRRRELLNRVPLHRAVVLALLGELWGATREAVLATAVPTRSQAPSRECAHAAHAADDRVAAAREQRGSAGVGGGRVGRWGG